MANLTHRPRRLRHTPTLRAMTRETQLSVANLICPIFVCPGHDIQRPISALPGQYQWSVDRLAQHAQTIAAAGIPAVLLFGLPVHKDEVGSESYAEDGTVQQAIRVIKQAAPALTVISDVCLCSYTAHGHCGPLASCGDTVTVDNDATLAILQKIAVSHAQAGADVVAPSGMMDGMIGAMREALDQAGFQSTAIMSYTAKYASSFYGPFREAADSTPQQGDRKSYQMDPANRREAIREAELDVDQGADFLMVKPALAYLDVIVELKQRFLLPLVAYNVSAEYAMVKAAAEKGWINEQAMMLEMLTSIKRAGADLIITYWALDAARVLKQSAHR